MTVPEDTRLLGRPRGTPESREHNEARRSRMIVLNWSAAAELSSRLLPATRSRVPVTGRGSGKERIKERGDDRECLLERAGRR
jgi:hypothetical protein